MEDAYRELKILVEKGDLSITYIDAPPRTVSSALFRSLTQVMHACAYEPFHFPSHGFEQGLKVLLEKAKRAGVYDVAAGRPVRLVTKEIARYLPAKDWERWMPLVDSFVMTIRDPFLQLHSLIRRAANDTYYQKYGASGLSDGQVWELAEQIGNILKDGGSIVGRPIPGNFDRTSWQSLREHLAKLEIYRHDYPWKQLLVVDGFLLRAIPEATMSEVLTRLGIEHDANTITKVVSGWDSDAGSDITRPDCSKDDAYRERVLASTGYEPPLDETPLLSMFPSVLQNHLKDSAMPIYLDLLCWPDRIGPRTPQALLSVLNIEVDGIRLVERNPVTAYALMASLHKEGLETAEQLQQTEQLENLGRQFLDHTDTFRLIDDIVSGYQTAS
jgi:hypothetical protein